MNILKLASLILCLLLANVSMADVKIKSMNFKKTNDMGRISIKYSGVLNDYPELKIKGNIIQVLVPNSSVSGKIEKAVSFSTVRKDTTLKVYKTNKLDSKIKAVLAFNIQKRQDEVSLTLRDHEIELSFPRVRVALKSLPKAAGIIGNKRKVKKATLNEAYLNKLLKIDKKNLKKKSPVSIVKAKRSPAPKSDTVKTGQAAPVKTGKSSISLIEYAGKFIAFLGVVLLLFFGVVSMIKKGFIKKGKLGFLNNTDQVMVLGQTFIAPKRSLMLIKAHKQVFLVSNTEAGINSIAEINDVAGLMKSGEVSISGQNFDTNLTEADSNQMIEAKIKLKEDISVSTPISAVGKYSQIVDKVKFSDQIKNKVKGLKSLQ